jgi:hypothetical protein
VPSPNERFVTPRLTPEGEVLYLDHLKMANGIFERYDRKGGTWIQTGTLSSTQLPPPGNSTQMGSVTALSSNEGFRRGMLTGNPTIIEVSIEDATGEYTVVHNYTGLVDLAAQAAQLLPDGLRMLIAGTKAGINAVYFGDRASVGEDFTSVVPLIGIPAFATDPFMTADCSRVYFSSAGTIFWAEQE